MEVEKGISAFKDRSSIGQAQRNHILAIAIDKYSSYAPLSNPVSDCLKLIEVLTDKYTFNKDDIKTIFDEQATRSGIYEAIGSFYDDLAERDNLLILFSGHGHLDERTNTGYWIPYDAKKSIPGFISKSDILDWVKPIKAHHIVFIVDCCFPGALLRGSQTAAADRLEEKNSRWVLASGRLEPVADGMPGDNSPFIKALISELEHNREAKIRLSDLGNKVINHTANNSNQTPLCRPVPGLDDLGGEFSFHLKAAGNTIFLHEFFVDSKLYQPLTETIEQLDEKIANQKGGYIFLAGSPGSGKSTLLTEWAKSRKERTVRYYAFTKIRANENLPERGEAPTLLIDLIRQLNALRGVTYYSPVENQSDSITLQRMFLQQLAELGQEFNSCGTPTYVIIDGLDHVPREYKPQNSFLNYLPNPDSIPDGVYIILGSQTFELESLNSNIKAIAGKTENCIQISPLSGEAVIKFIDSFDGTSSLTKEVKKMIFEKSGGHPLYLTYLLQKLGGSREINKAIVEAIEPYDQDIAKVYDKFWVDLKADPELIEPLGLISRWEGSILLDFIREWGLPAGTLQKLRDKASHFFDKTERTWGIFHNSFRQFLTEKTSIDPLTNKVCIQRHQGLFMKLAELCERSSVLPKWSATRYWFESGDLDRLLKVVNPDEFANQILDFRPYRSIKLDINMALEAARKKQDAMLVVRYIFALALLETREFNFESENLIEHLIKLGELEKAKAYLWEDQQLLLKGAYPLKIAKLLYDLGEIKEAAKILHLAEPEEIVNGEILMPPDDREIYDKMKSLSAWAELAVLMVPLEKFLPLVHNIRFVEDNSNRYHENHYSAASLTAWLLYDGGRSLAASQSWDKLDLLISDIADLAREEASNFHFRLLYYTIESACEDGVTDKARSYLGQLLSLYEFDRMTNEHKIYVLDLMFKLKFPAEIIKDKLKQIDQPNLVENPISYEREFYLFAPRVKLNKLLWAMGMPPSILKAVPDSEKEGKELMVLFERRICLVAGFIGKALSSLPQEFARLEDFKPLITMYYEFSQDSRNHHYYWLNQLKPDFYSLVIYAASLYGEPLLIGLFDWFVEEFSRKPQHWSSEAKRKILLTFEHYLAKGGRIMPHLEKLEETMLDELDVSSRIEECRNQAKAWIQLEEREKAMFWLKNAIQVSTGVGYRKDYQMNTWIDWIRKINRVDPAQSGERISWLLARLGYIRESTEGNTYHYASENLLKACCEWNLANGVEQLKWQLDNRLANFAEAISIFFENVIPTADEATLEILTQFFEKVFLLASEFSGRDLIAVFVKRQVELKGTSSLRTYLERLAHSVQIYALEEIRASYFSALIEEAEKAGIESSALDRLRKEDKGDSGMVHSQRNQLTLLPDRRSISQEDVLAQVDSYESFRSLFEQEDKVNSSFDWTIILKQISSELNPAHLLEISEFSSKGKDYREIERLGKLVGLSIDLGFDKAAEQIAFKALALSRGTDWIDHWSGGWKRKILKNLTRLKGDEARKIALDCLVEDVKKDSNLSVMLAQILDDILDVVQPCFDWKILWAHTFRYLQQLLANAKPLDDLPMLKRGDASAADLTAELLWYLTSYPSGLVTEACERVIVRAMIGGSPKYLDRCKQLLCIENDDQQELAVRLLSALVIEDPKLLQGVKEDLLNLAISPNGFTRLHAIAILEAVFPELEIPEIPPKTLPSLYSMYLEEAPNIELPQDLKAAKQQDQTSSATGLLEKLFSFHLKVLAEGTGFGLINIKTRAGQIMQRVAQGESLQPDYERKINNYLKTIDFETAAILRPNFPIAERTMVYLLSELMDAGHSIAGTLLARYCKFFDPALYFIEPEEKPAIIKKILERDEAYSFGKEEWLANIKEVESEDHKWSLDSFYVIGEFTIKSALDWGIPTELNKKSIYPLSDFQEGMDKSKVFGKNSPCRVREYLSSGIAPPYIIIQNETDFVPRLDCRAGWLALNPDIGYYLGWRPSGKALFCWENEEGEIMAKSIYWQSGNLKMSPHKMKSESGEGWLVLMSPQAIDQLVDKLGELAYVGYVHRAYQSEEWLTREVYFDQAFK
jgi:hypothetical protein